MIRLMWAHRPLFHLMIGMLLCLMPIAALAVWLPSFFVRMYGMTMHSAGPLSALVFGVFGSFGAAICSFMADRLGNKREDRKLLVPIFGCLLGVIFGLLGLLFAPSPSTALAALGPFAFLAQSVVGPGYSLVATLAPAPLRSATFAVLLVGINVLSYGLGVQLVGFVSDNFKIAYPRQSLAYGLATTLIFVIWGVLHLWRSMYLIRHVSPAVPSD
jgi:MFS family permease